jgi:hypothetical protein
MVKKHVNTFSLIGWFREEQTEQKETIFFSENMIDTRFIKEEQSSVHDMAKRISQDARP